MNNNINMDLKKRFDQSLKQAETSQVDAHMLMFRFLSEVEKITDDRNISRRALAKLVGTSPSYITQLYRGNKIINLDLIGKLQKALDIKFEITAVPCNNVSAEKEYMAFFFEKPTVLNRSKSRGHSELLDENYEFESYKLKVNPGKQKDKVSA